MDKQNTSNPTNNYNVPLGVGTSTSSGVTVFDPSVTNNNPPPPPPTYDQAMGNPATAAKATGTYTTSAGWNAPGMGAANAGYNTTTTTTYTTYGTTVPPSTTQQPRNVPQQTTFVQPPVVIIQQQPMLPLGPEPVYLTCPACHIQKLTRIEYEPSSRTHLMAALLCLVGLWCCVCLPYCAGSCMNTHHYCGNCGKFLGTYGNAL
ncbi:lipopolysaccharide-induced tumor necrosis factor-alpha factor homolog [Lucilia cuprina]|uniref:lipopolysaccharide-induced tumor necrosis factor-alpha factor homolog n=1 Tax=Lucilia cuprina TaxID=7375 RepID=UPI001F05546E|nr:lipopolysaccharide-induced tumor necrosis factor-alpha factor homolog [Lucilia cuprina]